MARDAVMSDDLAAQLGALARPAQLAALALALEHVLTAGARLRVQPLGRGSAPLVLEVPAGYDPRVLVAAGLTRGRVGSRWEWWPSDPTAPRWRW